jgi:RNA polymerase I-specific transcription initiation factor RRN3
VEVLSKLVADAKRLSTGKVNKKAASSIMTAATLEHRRKTGGVGGLGRGSNPLKLFFPFDPLLLRQSHEYIEPLYKYWQGPVEEEDMLVIDEVERDHDPTFDMDDGSLSESDGENGDSEIDSDDDDNSETYNSEVETEDDVAPRDMLTPDAYKIKLLQQKAWTETLKRPRSQSMENGSW